MEVVAGCAAACFAGRSRLLPAAGPGTRAPPLPPRRDGVGEHPRHAVLGQPRQLALAVGAQVARDYGACRPHNRGGRHVDPRAVCGRAVEEFLDPLLECLQCHGTCLARTLAVEGVDEQESSGVRVLLQGAGELAQHATCRTSPVLLGGSTRGGEDQQALGSGPVSRHEAVFLVLKLRVEGCAGDARVGADLGDGHGLGATLLGREVDGRVDQPLALRASVASSRRSCRGARPAAPRCFGWLSLCRHFPHSGAYCRRATMCLHRGRPFEARRSVLGAQGPQAANTEAVQFGRPVRACARAPRAAAR